MASPYKSISKFHLKIRLQIHKCQQLEISVVMVIITNNCRYWVWKILRVNLCFLPVLITSLNTREIFGNETSNPHLQIISKIQRMIQMQDWHSFPLTDSVFHLQTNQSVFASRLAHCLHSPCIEALLSIDVKYYLMKIIPTALN